MTKFDIKFTNTAPLYMELYNFIKKLILEKKLSPNEKLPSKRNLSNYLGIKHGMDIFGLIRGTAEPWWWDPKRVTCMRTNAGFFPLNEASIIKFCEMVLNDTEQVDILGSWLTKEKNVSE